MLILKIMSGEDLADDNPSKPYRLIADVVNVDFYTATATQSERARLGYDEEGPDVLAHHARIHHPQGGVSRYLITGNVYVMNDRGDTIDTYWPGVRKPPRN